LQEFVSLKETEINFNKDEKICSRFIR